MSAHAVIRIVVMINLADASPRELRERFVEQLRAFILRAREQGRIDIGIAEELVRALPERGRA